MESLNQDKIVDEKQNLLIFQQNNSGESKIKGIMAYGDGRYNIERFSIDTWLPPVIDDPQQGL